MAEIATLARPYAEAVFKLADESGKLAEWSETLRRMAQVAANPDVQACIGNPQVSAGQLYEVVLAATGELPTEARNFAQILIRNDRLALLPDVRSQFEVLKHEREGVVDADIATAFPLEDGQLGELVGALEKRFRRRINPQVRVDKELIGGVRIAVGDEVIDDSVRGKLAAMATAVATV